MNLAPRLSRLNNGTCITEPGTRLKMGPRLLTNLFTGHEPDSDVRPLLRQQDARGRIHLKVLWGRLLLHLPADVEGNVLWNLWEGRKEGRFRTVMKSPLPYMRLEENGIQYLSIHN